MSLTARGLDVLREAYPQAYSALKDIVAGENNIGRIAGIGVLSPAQAPQNTGTMDVLGADGIFDVAIIDPNPQRGEHYFVEWDVLPGFTSAYTIYLGPSRSWRGFLGDATRYWRWYKQLFGSNVSSYAYFGTAALPTPVAGGGAFSGPALHSTVGSGTSRIAGKGWGDIGAIQPTPPNL